MKHSYCALPLKAESRPFLNMPEQGCAPWPRLHFPGFLEAQGGYTRFEQAQASGEVMCAAVAFETKLCTLLLLFPPLCQPWKVRTSMLDSDGSHVLRGHSPTALPAHSCLVREEEVNFILFKSVCFVFPTDGYTGHTHRDRIHSLMPF